MLNFKELYLQQLKWWCSKVDCTWEKLFSNILVSFLSHFGTHNITKTVFKGMRIGTKFKIAGGSSVVQCIALQSVVLVLIKKEKEGN